MKKWSISAHNCFQRCQRQYFFNYIMSHHNAKDEKRREAYLLKQLSTLNSWKGKLVHLALERYFVPSLSQDKIISCAELTDRTLALGKQQWEFSQQSKYLNQGITKSKAGDLYLALRNHQDTINSETESREKVFDEIKQCYQNLYAYDDFINFLLNDAGWHETEFRLSFKLDGVTIVGQPDLLVGYGNSKICVIDWKTGKSKTTDYSTQLYLYSIAVVKSWKWSDYNLQDLLLVEANLFQNKFEKYFINKTKAEEIKSFINRSIIDIQAVTGDHKYSLNNLKNYTYAENPISCRYCSFEPLCKEID